MYRRGAAVVILYQECFLLLFLRSDHFLTHQTTKNLKVVGNRIQIWKLSKCSHPGWFCRAFCSKAYRCWRLENRSLCAGNKSFPPDATLRPWHSHARRRLRANTSCRIKRCSGWYHPRRYHLQRFCTATAGCACTPNAKSRFRWLLWILIKPV